MLEKNSQKKSIISKNYDDLDFIVIGNGSSDSCGSI